MKIILLRHEERGIDVSYHSNLTENGIINANTSLKKKLEKMKIDIIFSSPFIRTLQTIYPYSNANNKKINLEYGLYEYIHNPYFLFIDWYQTYDNINDADLKSIVNTKYKSKVVKNDFSILENEDDLERRIKIFFDSLLKKKYDKKTILLVTHKGVINKIKSMYFQKTAMDDLFEMGHIETYTFKKELSPA
jgi:broad specificity phosphatase PhoE